MSCKRLMLLSQNTALPHLSLPVSSACKMLPLLKATLNILLLLKLRLNLLTKIPVEAILKGLGNGQDSGDKAIAKGLTSALKYAYMMSLAISTGDDPEADQHTDENTFVEENDTAPINQQQQPPPRQIQPIQQQSQLQQRPRQQAIRNNNLTCYDCGAKISQKVADFSVSKFGRRLCFDCQQAEQAVA